MTTVAGDASLPSRRAPAAPARRLLADGRRRHRRRRCRPRPIVPADRRGAARDPPPNAFVMTDMMADVIQRGTAQLAKSLGRRDLAGKTGTTNDRRDAWFVRLQRGSRRRDAGSASTRSARSATAKKAAALRCRCGSTSWMRRCAARPNIASRNRRDCAHVGIARTGRAGARRRIRARCSRRSSPGTRPAAVPDDGSIEASTPKRGAGRERGVDVLSARCAAPTLPVVWRVRASDGTTMSRRPNPSADLMRQAVADEAARIMREQGVEDFLHAKRKAAERLGVIDAVDPAAQHGNRGRDARASPPVRARPTRGRSASTCAAPRCRPCG